VNSAWRWLAAVAALAAALTIPSTASAAGSTRSEFVSKAELLCRDANRAISRRSDQLYRRYQRLRPDGSFPKLTNAERRRDDALFYGGYARVLIFQGQTVHALDKRLQMLPLPQGDESVISQWIESRRVDADLVKRAGRQLKHVARRKPQRALNLLFSFESIQDQLGLTDLIVGSFGFDQCYLANEDP